MSKIMFINVEAVGCRVYGKMRLKSPQILGDGASLPRDFIICLQKQKVNNIEYNFFFFVLFQKYSCMKPNETEGSCVEYKQTYGCKDRCWRLAKMWMCQDGPVLLKV